MSKKKRNWKKKENGVRELMRKYMKKSSFIMWRKRVKSRKTKHKTNNLSTRFKSKNQKQNEKGKVEKGKV